MALEPSAFLSFRKLCTTSKLPLFFLSPPSDFSFAPAGEHQRYGDSSSGGGEFVEPLFFDAFLDDLFELRLGDGEIHLNLTLRVAHGHGVRILGGHEGQEDILALLNR